jgi:hypothetical protein
LKFTILTHALKVGIILVKEFTLLAQQFESDSKDARLWEYCSQQNIGQLRAAQDDSDPAAALVVMSSEADFCAAVPA